MNNQLVKRNNEMKVLEGEVIDEDLQSFINDNKALSIIQKGINHNIMQYDRNVANLGSVNDRYFEEVAKYNYIQNDVARKYGDLKYDQDQLKSHIDNANYPYGHWKYKKRFYYRASPSSELCKGNTEQISEDISERYPMNVQLIPDLNNLINKPKEIRSYTVYISTKSIIVIEGEVINTTQQYEIFQDNQGKFFRNLIINTEYLNKRFINYSLNPNKPTKTRVLVQKMTTLKDALFLLNRLGKFFKTLQGENLIVMMGNKDVSEGIFWNKIITPMISPENYIMLTDDVLREKSIKEILKGKILIHVDHIPQTQEHREKLKELLINISIHKSFQADNKKMRTFAQVIVTLDEADSFIKDFEHLSDIFYIEPMNDIVSKLNEINDVSLIGNIEDSLIHFAEELSAIGMQQFNANDYSTGNKKFLLELQEEVESTEIISDMGLPILDPYSDTYENIIANKNRFKHSYIIANQGFGKSQLIISLICRDIFLNDCSVVLLDPHGDLAEDLLKIIKDKDKERLVYIDPYLDDTKTPTINLFHIVEDNEESIHNVSQVILSVLKTINGDEKFSGAMEDVAENCIKVLLREGGGSFLELYKFLNATGSKEWVKLGRNSQNPLEADFFNNDFEASKTTRDAVRRRLKKLLNDPKFSAFMNGPKSTLNLERLVNTKGKIIIINIASGRMPNTYQYYMKFLVGYLQLIALKRVSTPMDERVHTQLYLDEFHLFLDKSRIFEEVLTGARKYRMFLTFAHQSLAQVRDSNLKEIIKTIPTRYFIGNIANKTIDGISEALNAKLDSPESLLSGQFYHQEDNADPYKIQNTDRFLGTKEDSTPTQVQETIEYQLDRYYRPIKAQATAQHTEEDQGKMIQQFKSDFISKSLTKPSCLHKLELLAPDRFTEIQSDFNHVDAETNIERPRVRQQEFSTIFQLVFELNDLITNRRFIQMLKVKDKDDMFNQTNSGTRLGDFTDDGKTQTGQYYYFEW